MSFEDIELYTDMQKVQIKNTEMKLTRTEYAILKLLMKNQMQEQSVQPTSFYMIFCQQDNPFNI